MARLTELMLILLVLITFISPQDPSPAMRQPPEVLEAYRVCEQFNTILAQDFDFDKAFEATFTRNAARRRAIAITEGEFGELDLAKVDDATLISAYKARMNVLYQAFTLIGADNKVEYQTFFSPEIEAIFKRKPPPAPDEFPAYAQQLERDASTMRSHVAQLATKNPRVANGIQQLKEMLSKKLTPPDHIVKPLTAYSRGRVLSVDEEYYKIAQCSVIREDGAMRIIGLQFFDRLF